MPRVKKSRTIGFRLTEELWQQVEKRAANTGATPHDWCREAAIERLKREQESTLSLRTIYEELSRVRFLLGHGFRLLAGNQLTVQEWLKWRNEADQKPAEIADLLLTQTKASGRS